jgi:hypothetical protein
MVSESLSRHDTRAKITSQSIFYLLSFANCRSWYAYVVELCINNVNSGIEAFFLLLFYHICFVFLVWSYYKTIFTPVAIVPAPFRVSREELDQLFKTKNPDEQARLLKHLSADLPILNCTINNCVRFCEKCQHIKPDRAHHCSVCNVCNLKMGECRAQCSFIHRLTFYLLHRSSLPMGKLYLLQSVKLTLFLTQSFLFF